MTDDAARRRLVLSRVRRALGRPGDAEAPAPVRQAVDARIRGQAPSAFPMRAQLQQPQLGALFDEQVRASAATLVRVASPERVPEAVRDWCASIGVTDAPVVGPASPLADLPWGDDPPERRLARSGDAVAVASAAVAVAETGSLGLCSGPENPVTANFLPENHVIVIHEADLVATAEDAWARLRMAASGLPRTVNWITGPSRSGDIEMTMLMGAHGPVRVHVVVVEKAAP